MSNEKSSFRCPSEAVCRNMHTPIDSAATVSSAVSAYLRTHETHARKEAVGLLPQTGGLPVLRNCQNPHILEPAVSHWKKLKSVSTLLEQAELLYTDIHACVCVCVCVWYGEAA
jgi:hypothetical protein